MGGALQEQSRARRGTEAHGIVIRTYDLWKTYVMGDQEIPRGVGRGYRDQAGRICGHHGALGFGQIHADELIGCLDTPRAGCTTSTGGW